MSRNSTNFEDKKMNKSTFYKNKKLFNMHDLDVNKILVPKKESYGAKNSPKYFIGYNDYGVIRPVFIKPPQMIGYIKQFASNKTMLVKILKKICNLLNIEFGSEPVYGDNDKYLKTKIKRYEDRVNTNFQGKKVPKENASCKCLSLIMLDSFIRVNKKYYPQTFLEECKYVIKKVK